MQVTGGFAKTDYENSLESQNKNLQFNNARLASIIYSIVKHKGKEWNLLLENAAEDDLPNEIRIGYNIVGDDAIVTVLFGSTLKRMIIQEEEK